jgi:type VI secretion system protein ImpF
MRAPTQAERLKPSLLDRLTDDAPAERRDAEHKRFASTKQLRESVVRDLGWLLNSVRLAAVQDLDAYPHVAKSVLNFGLPDLAGRTASSVDGPLLERQLRQVIVDFEPRLLSSTITVRVVKGSHEASPNSLQLRIEAELVAHPVPVFVWLRTEIDLENGQVSIAEWEREPTPRAS